MWSGATGPAAAPRRAGPFRMTREARRSSRTRATVVPDRLGLWTLPVQAWSDPLATWRHAVQAQGGRRPVRRGDGQRPGDRRPAAGTSLPAPASATPARSRRSTRCATPSARSPSGSARAVRELCSVLAADPIRELVTASDPVKVWVDRPLAEFGSWYEFFPRSSGADIDPAGLPIRHGTFTDASSSTASPSMGFDIVYLPPIHPIGEVNRKGRNNSVSRRNRRSPRRRVAVGHRLGHGGHDAVHPDWAPSTISTTSSPRPGTRPGGGARPRPAVLRPITPGSASTRNGSPPGRTAPSPTRRTRPRSTRTSTR